MRAKPDASIREIDWMPLRWADDFGIIHAAEGAYIPNERGELILWTVCGRRDIPANSAWKGHDEVECAQCAATLRGKDWEPSEAEQGLIPIPDRYNEA